jgi:periplasmic divalent cation tolerance protein
MEENSQPVILLVTVPDRDSGELIARELLERRLAACVNIIPGLTSCFRWKGEIQQDSELLLIIKTHLDLLEGHLIPEIKQLHPYQLPEIIALPIIGGDRGYLDWLIQETRIAEND